MQCIFQRSPRPRTIRRTRILRQSNVLVSTGALLEDGSGCAIRGSENGPPLHPSRETVFIAQRLVRVLETVGSKTRTHKELSQLERCHLGSHEDGAFARSDYIAPEISRKPEC